MNSVPFLTESEKAYFDTVRDKATLPVAEKGHLYLTRMVFDGEPVAVIGADVFNRFSGNREGMMPLAMLLTDESILNRLTQPDGVPPVAVSPHDLDHGV